MKTLLSVNNYHYFRGGAETVFLRHNEAFEELGWKVVPFSMQHPKNLPSPWSSHFVEEIELGSPYPLGQKIVKATKAIYSFEARRKIDELIKQTRPSICHAHNIYHHISPAILGMLKKREVPTVLTLHDLKMACPAYSMLSHDGVCERCKGGKIHNVVTNRCMKGSLALSTFAFIETALHRMLGSYRDSVDRFVVPSRFYLNKFAEWGFPTDRFVHIPNFVDTAPIKPDYQPGNDLVFVGRVSKEKGIATLIKASARTGIPVRIIGGGPILDEMQTLVKSLQAPVVFSGFLSGEALIDGIRTARALILPSEWYENAPLTILEAYAAGKPVIGARIGGIPELIRVGETGMIFESGNVDALADAMQNIRDLSSSQIEEMGKAGRALVESQFGFEHYRSRIVALYDSLNVSK